MGPGPGTLIGRERELAAFRLVLDEVGVGGSRSGAAGDGGSFLLVTGEPGIGKTRLLEAAAAEAEARGFLVAWGRAWEAGGAPAFWPWIQIRRALDRERGRTAAPASAAVAATFPDLAVAGTPGGPEGAAPGAGTSDRFLLFDAVAQALIAASAERPLLLLLDDLHAADPSSIQLLELVTGQVGGARVAIVGSYREVEARILPEVRDPLGRLSRRARTLPLGRMGRAEVAAFVRRSPTLPDDDTVVGLVHDATDGNPLFIGELVRLIETRAGETRAGRLPVPDGVRAVMRERIRLLPPACAELLAHAAVIGREFQSPLLAEVAAVAVDAVPTALAAAVETGLLEERAPGHYAFSHALVVETLVRDLEPGRRGALHLMVARALERRHQDDPAAPLGTLAHHFLESGALSAAEAVAAARRAAARALEGLAFEDAAALLERALASEALVVPPDGARRAELLLSLGEASLRGGAADRGKQACQEAAELARALGRPDLLARAALGYGLEFAFAVVDARLVALLEEALRALPATDRSLRWLRARVMARLAAALQPAIDPTAPVALAREAIALVQEKGAAPPEPGAPGPDEAAAVRLDVLHIAGSALVEYVPSEELIPLHEEVVALAGARRDRPRRLRALLRLVFAHLERGDRAASRRAVGDYEAAAAEFTQPRYRWPSILLRSMEAALDGRFDACARLIAEARALDAGADANLQRSLNAHRVLVAGQAIEDAEAREVLEEHLTMIAPGGHDHVSRVWRAIMPANVRAGLFEPGLLAAFTEAQLVALCQDFNVACLLAEACAMVDDRAHAAPIAAALAARAGRVCVTTMGFGVQDLADRSLLLLA
ncbi:MAG TPA: AAA family ATPase, partial [Polyangia bacterium]